MNPTQRNNRLTLIRQVAQYAQRRRQLAMLVERLDRHAELSRPGLSTAARVLQETYPQAVDKSEIQDMVESQH